ncbi:MAG: DNA/RNA helicase domain-containing protein [Candidatus Omnitrophota bacterium]
MIIYKSTVKKFVDDIFANRIDEEIDKACLRNLGRSMLKVEGGSWRHSLGYMERVVREAELPDDCGILIEYVIPSTFKRIDFIVSGKDNDEKSKFIIIELKQWDNAASTNKDSIVTTLLGGNPERETTHPSYQAYSYKMFLKDFNENVYKGQLLPFSCACLHNYIENNPEPLKAEVYSEIVKDTPLFFKHDTQKLAEFIKRHVGKGQGEKILYEIESGRIRPSRKLIDHVCGMFKGNKEFILIDEQKVAYEKAIDIALNATEKSVLIIKGGPGTGKSVVSINVLGGILSAEKNVAFVAPNASFRDVMVKSLAKENRISRIKHLFKGSASFNADEKHIYDVLIVDEAHRLKNGSAYQYKGDNQVEDIINASFVSIFFIDDNQRIRPEDIGTVEELKRVAMKYTKNIDEIELVAQFRCSGAEGYINWLDDVFHIKQTANYDGWNNQEFDFKICQTPQELHAKIKQKNSIGLNARILAGYAWGWTSEKDGNNKAQIKDVSIPEHNFSLPWNSRSMRTSWAIEKEGVNQVGCIHTSQGLEFDYVGVIIGNDLRFNSSDGSYSVDWKSYKDSAGKKGLKGDLQQLSTLIRNIYKTLMTRGMKGCYVYFCDKEVEKYFKERLKLSKENNSRLMFSDIVSQEDENRICIEELISDDLKFNEYLPFYSLAAACGYFGEGLAVEKEGWIKAEGIGCLRQNMFVVTAVGKSMEPLINDGSYCVFRTPVVGSRNNKIVLVQHNECPDPETGGKYSIKKYTSKKSLHEDGTWSHEQIILDPLNSKYEPIIIDKAEDGEFMVIGEFIAVLNKKKVL